MTDHKAGDLKLWWIPQIPMTAFEVPITSLHEGAKILDVLADYDLFQLEHNIKPDFSNMGGLSRYEEDGDGYAWFDVEESEYEL